MIWVSDEHDYNNGAAYTINFPGTNINPGPRVRVVDHDDTSVLSDWTAHDKAKEFAGTSSYLYVNGTGMIEGMHLSCDSYFYLNYGGASHITSTCRSTDPYRRERGDTL